MSDKPQVLVADEGGRRKRPSALLPPSAVQDLAPIFIIGGLALALAGGVDVALFYYPMRFGEAEWEFGIIAQTVDALPAPTMALVLLGLGFRARGGRAFWCKALGVLAGVAALTLLALLVIFALDIPVAFQALARAARTAAQQGGQANPLVSSGLKRGIAKVLVLGTGYLAAYVTLAVVLWRGGKRHEAES